MQTPARLNPLRIPRLLLVPLLLLLTVGCATTTELVAPPAGILDPEINELFNAAMVDQAIIGAAVGVVRDGEVIHLQPYGTVDARKRIPVTLATPFRWASISKPLTAVAALQLVESGALTLDARAGDLVPSWPGSGGDPADTTNTLVDPETQRKARVTVEHLLRHRSGVHHYGKGTDGVAGKFDWDKGRHRASYWNAEQSVRVFSRAPLDFEPGSRYLYTTFGFNLLGAVIEEVSPKGYVAWVGEFIAEPAGMSSLRPATDDYRGFRGTGSGEIVADRERRTWYKLPGGAWSSNIGDGLAFARGLLEGTFLVDATLWPNEPGAPASGYWYGISYDDERAWHSGGQTGVDSFMALRRDENVGVVIFCNSEWAEIRDIAWQIADLAAAR